MKALHAQLPLQRATDVGFTENLATRLTVVVKVKN